MTFLKFTLLSKEGDFLPSNRYKKAPKSPGFSRQTHHPRLSTCLLSAHSSQCVSQLLLSSLSRPSRSPPSPLPSKLGTSRTAMSITRAKTVEARITTTATRARMAVVETALGRRCLSTRMTSRDGTRASTPPTSTRKSTRSPSRSVSASLRFLSTSLMCPPQSARASARRMINVTLARRTRMMRRMTSSSASCLWRSSTSTPGRKTVMMARMTKTTRMATRTTGRTTGRMIRKTRRKMTGRTTRKTTGRTTRSTTTLLPGTPTTDIKSDGSSYGW
ncbi:hypothetical protein EV421DRAFT_1757544 [Armillaria borealis]|uniref:Uncharacterized protein n=1 Tax=Armillaria borealis TaxID=47425 RepID=A0AA39K4V3_9AGAR|nr:hypothetical protein EV421DRAFT_1757544 [Armillaria borealis]